MKKITNSEQLDNIIDQVQEIRAKNNNLWMDLLRIASRRSPKNTLKILKEITSNDKQISNLLGEIK